MARQAPPPRRTKDTRHRAGTADAAVGDNTLRSGRVVRTMWAGEAGTLRWQAVYGPQLLCVRHREDPAGLRRLVTVELVIGPVAARAGQRRLRDRAWYPLALNPDDAQDASLIRRVRHHGGRWHADGHWYLTGALVRAWGLMERIAMRPGRARKR